jgi:LuxR family transcriptional regulator, maltose regulon positive regulatory protein
MILTTKLHIPQSRCDLLVERPSIIEMLNEGLHTKLTFVTAPGGYGKTTALSQWVQKCGIPSVWVSLDSQDNDLHQFWSYVIAAIESKNPYFAEAMNPYLSVLKTGAYESLLTAMIHEFSSRNDELVLILDDYHSIQLSSIHVSVARLLENLPNHIHMYIASRAELPFPTARLHANSQTVKITIQNLRFQLSEGIRYFRECMRFSLSENDISSLVQRTEGWISGLHLAAISLKESNNVPDFIHAFNGEHRSISDYLFQEVLRHQSEEVQTFLLETSILTRMNDALCEAVTGQANCQERLEALEQQNLFIIPLDEQRQWFRYHHLFSDFLQRQFRKKYTARFKQLHVHAADWMEEHGFFEEAVEYFLKSKHHLQAASLIEKHLQDLYLKSGVLHRWFRALPDSCFESKPRIQFLYVKVLAESGEVEQAWARLQTMEDKMSDPAWKTLVGTFLYISAAVSFYRRDFQKTSEYLELFEKHMPEGSYIQMIEANVYSVNFNSLLVFFNDLHEADLFFSKWIKVWETKKKYPYVGFFYVAYSQLLYEWNRLDEAEMYVERALLQKQMQPYAIILVSAAITAARVYQAKGDSVKAFKWLEQTKLKINSPDKGIFVKMLDREKAYLSLANGSLDDAIAWLQTCGMKHTDTVSLNDFSAFLQLAKVLTECGSYMEALQLLEHLYQLVYDEDRLRDQIKVTILQSMVFHRKGDGTNALMKLEAALQLAEPGEYLRSFIDEGEQMADLLLRYLNYRQHNNFIDKSSNVSLLYVKKLLLLMNETIPSTTVSGLLVTKQELKIVSMIEQGMSNKQIAEQLQITAETVKSHIKNIYRKLGVNSRLQALHRGKELNLL